MVFVNQSTTYIGPGPFPVCRQHHLDTCVRWCHSPDDLKNYQQTIYLSQQWETGHATVFGLEVLSVQDSANCGTASVGGGQGGQENRDCRRNHNFTLRFSVQVSELWFTLHWSAAILAKGLLPHLAARGSGSLHHGCSRSSLGVCEAMT